MMECNKDEAIRAQEIAERKLTEKDFAGAKKFALKAQALYPGLEGLSQMLTILDVYIAAENKISGEVDWYGVLDVAPLADEDTVRKQYRKLALMLHPDKNKSVGADGAFKLISEAWSLLSDKGKRLAYNQRRSSKGFQQKILTKSGGPSTSASANAFHNFPNMATSAKTQDTADRVRPPSVPPPYPRTDTFWTICKRCKMHYEYLKVYLNHTLLCPNCHEAFLASETAPPVNFSKLSTPSSRQQHQNPGNRSNGNSFDPGRYAAAAQQSEPGKSAGVNSFNHIKVQQSSINRTAGFSSGSAGTKAANFVQQANARLKREREATNAAAGWDRGLFSGPSVVGESLFKKARGLNDDFKPYGGNIEAQMATGVGGAGMRSISGLRTDMVQGLSGIFSKLNSIRELTPLETRNMLMGKARVEILKKLNEWKSETVNKAAESQKEKLKENKKEKEKSTVKGDSPYLNGHAVPFDAKRGDQAKKCSDPSPNDTDKEKPDPMSINVPDPDFHDFDLDRTESSFGDSEVWAAYDDDDGMPRFYAMIHKVVSLKPFKVRLSWLNSKSTTEFGPINWVSSGFAKTCGEFRVGKYEISKSLNSFSHKVKWEKGPRGAICLFPRKGDIWALYRNWSPDWNEHTPDELIHVYDMVKVLDDYSEDQGVSVIPLVKVAGFRTVFHPHTDPEKVKRIPKEEMFRFSHQVPSYLLTGLEASRAPKGCQELDPAATPMELLQVLTEADMVPGEEKKKKSVKVTSHSAPEATVSDEILDKAATVKQEMKDKTVELEN